MTFALVTMFSIFFVYSGATRLFGDSDTGWHIRNGERIISSGGLPHADPYSFSKPGQAWVAWEWGADVLMGAADRAAGPAGIAVMYGALISASVWMWFRLNQAAGGNVLMACLFFIPMISTTSLHWLARPHVFSWLFLPGMVWVCERAPVRVRWWHYALTGAGAAIWANIHASFPMAPLIALIYAAGAYLKPKIWECGDISQQWPARRFVLLALSALAGTLLNPNGWQLHRHVLLYLSDSSLLDRITEFQSFDFHQHGAWQVMLALAACAAGAFAALAVRRTERFLISALLIAMALRSVRALPLAVLVVLPLAGGSITEVLSGARGLTPSLRAGITNALNYGDRLYAAGRQFHGFALTPVVLVLIFFAIRTQTGFPATEFPVAASRAVAALPRDARILTSDSFGGYLIYRFNGERKVFFDGRSDFYGEEFTDGYLKMIAARPGWRGEFNRWNFTDVLLPADCSLIPALETSGWREIYRDKTAVLLAGSPKV